MKNFLKISLALIKIFICLLFTFIIGFTSCIIFIISVATQFSWQILLYVLLSIIVVIGLWLISFLKTTHVIKILWMGLFIGFVFAFYRLPDINTALNINHCIDRGHCWDSHRNRCEEKDQCMCVKNAEKCKNDFNGVWDEEMLYCTIKR